MSEPAPDAFLGFARNTLKGRFPHLPAPLAIVEALEAATKADFDAGMGTEWRLFVELMSGSVSGALRHAFLAERAAAKIPDVPEAAPVREIKRVGVIGAGTMGTGIAINFLNAGIPVTLLEVGPEALGTGVARVAETYEGQVRKGRIEPDEAKARVALLTPTLKYEDLAAADLVIEAVFEDMTIKEQVFRKLDGVAKAGAILASNTSTLDLDGIASVTRRPADVIGMHFFSPANVMRLLEVVRGKEPARRSSQP